MAENYYTVGKIVNTHGLRGEVKIWPRTDFPEIRFAKGSQLYVVDPVSSRFIPLEVASSRSHKNVYLTKFKGLDRIEDVEKWKGAEMKITEDQLIELEDHEYYYHEIIGCEVIDESGNRLGKVTEILHSGANDVWVCKQPKGKDILIPYIEDVVLDVNTEQKIIQIRLLEGML